MFSYLFIITAEIVRILIRNIEHIKGINIHDIEFFRSLFDDDTTTLLDGTMKSLSLHHTLKLLVFFPSISRLHINTICFKSTRNSGTQLKYKDIDI